MTLATSEEQLAVCAAIGAWSASIGCTDIVRETLDKSQTEVPVDRWRPLFAQLAEFGVFGAAVSEEAGGLGATLADAIAMIEQCGHDLVPGPIVATVAAAVLCARSTDVRAPELVARLVAGETTAVVAGAPIPEPTPDVIDLGLVDLGLVPGYVDGAMILAERADGGGWVLIPPGVATRVATPVAAIDGTGPLTALSLDGWDAADVIDIDDGPVLAGLVAAGRAAYASGVSRWALDTVVAYATVRTQFGAPIGSFQAIKHICAEMLCSATQVEAAAWDLTNALCRVLDYGNRAPNDALDQLELSRLVADVVVADLPVSVAKDAIQVLGGIGFTYEHDAHLYLRSALSTRAELNSAREQRGALGDLGCAGLRRQFDIDLSEVEGRRAEVRAIAQSIAAESPERQRDLLVESGYLAPHWPRPHGLAAGPALQLLIDSELDNEGVIRPDLVIGAWAVPTILAHGTDAQRDRFVAPTLQGLIVWCQLFSEPEAGSDLAALRTRATRVEGGWVLSGQKIWTSQAHRADWGICLARTDSEVPKHKGITYFLLDMTAPGIDIRPLRELTGRANFNEVFLDDVFVPDDCVVAAPGDGWRLARTTLANERVAMGGSGLGKEMEQLLTQIGLRSQPLTVSDRQRLGELVAQAQIGRVLDAQAVTRRLQGHDPGALSSVRKLIGVAHRQAVPDFAFDLLGPAGATACAASDLLLQNRCLSIAGGTTQILRSTVAERILGLPRS